MYLYLPYLFVLSFFLSAVVIGILIKSPLVSYFADTPDYRKVHQQIVPRIGGMGLILCFLGILLFTQVLFPNLFPSLSTRFIYTLLSLSGVLLVVGTLDDTRGLNFKIKFLFQFGLAALVVIGFDLSCHSIFLLHHEYQLGMFGSLVSIFWLVGIMNALNIVDGIDGLASSVSMIGFGTMAILAYANHSSGIVMLCVVLIALNLGFLVHNMSVKNKTFLGDTGSLFLGSMLGALSIQTTQSPVTDYSILVPLMIVGYPIFDITVAMVRRFLGRVHKQNHRIQRRFFKMFEADNEHLHHRLVHWGMSHIQTTFLLSLIAFSMGCVAISISRVPLMARGFIFAYLLVGLFLILNRFNYLGKKNWLTFPRQKQYRAKLVGVIEPDELFFHSLRSYNQHDLEFINIPLSMSNQFRDQLSAIIIHNALCEHFDVCWQYALRIAEVNDCPVFVIADKKMLKTVHSKNEGFETIELIQKPVVVPELLDTVKEKINQFDKNTILYEDPLVEVEAKHKGRVRA